MSVDSGEKRPAADISAANARGEKAFAIFDYVITVVKVSVLVLGVIIVIIALSGVDMSSLDEHEIFRYRMHAAFALIVGYLAIDALLSRRRQRRARDATDALAKAQAASAPSEFALSIDPVADRRAAMAEAAAKRVNQDVLKRSYTVVWMALAFVAAGGVAFWQDHVANEIPNAVAVPATFVSAKCVEARRGSKGVSVGPHMSIGYEFASRSTSARTPQVQCLLENCEPETAPRQHMDTEYKRVFYAGLSECEVALPAVLAAKAPTTVWTGDKDPNASVRARFTPEREKPPYFLLWFPSIVAAVVLLISGFKRTQRARPN